MTYRLLVGPSRRGRDRPEIVGSIEFTELPTLYRLVTRTSNTFLTWASAYFDDQTIEADDVNAQLDSLLPLLIEELEPDERNIVCRLIAALAYARALGMPLLGTAS
jgi:hypothetical protein